MVSSPSQVVTGSSVIDQIIKYLDVTGGHGLTASALSGYIDPYLLGLEGSSMLPTLSREQAERQYALDVAKYGLDQARLNFDQRVSAADARLKELSLLSSQRGPGNSIAYNYALRGMSAPAGQQVSPYSMSQSINMPYEGGVSPAQPTRPAIPVPPQQPTPTGGYPMRPVEPEPARAPQTPTAALASAASPAGAGGSTTPAPAASPSPAIQWQPQVEPDRGRTVASNNPTIASLPTAQRQVLRMADGGMTDDRIVMVGDKQGQETGAEELVVNPTGAPMAVVPNEALPSGMDTAPAGKPSAEEVLLMIGRLIESLGVEDEQAPEGVAEALEIPAAEGGGSFGRRKIADEVRSRMRGRISRYADGGIFGTTLYSPGEIAGQPALQAASKGQRLAPFGGNALDMVLPGTDTSLPMGHQMNIGNYASMLPSEQEQLRGAIETPREMGGLGLMFGDWLTSAVRAAPVGRSFGASGYGW